MKHAAANARKHVTSGNRNIRITAANTKNEHLLSGIEKNVYLLRARKSKVAVSVRKM